MERKNFCIFTLFLVFLHLLFRIHSYRREYLIPFDPLYWRQRYLRSQWVNPTSSEPIGDDGLYAYVGWEYVHGQDPTLLNAQIPPLGKYLLGLSEVVFGNQNIFALLSGLAVLLVFFPLSTLYLPFAYSALPVLFFSLEPLFFEQLRAPFLDNLYLAFLLLVFYFFLKAKRKKKFLNFCLSSFFLGCFAAVKFPFLAPLVAFSLICTLWFSPRGDWQLYLLSLPLSFLPYLFSYFRFFQLGGNWRDFLAVQKWIFSFYRAGAKVKPGKIWPLIFLGKWSVWWKEETLSVFSWRLTWPILGITPFVCLFLAFRRKIKFDPIFLFWSFFYLLFLSFIPVFPRYLLLLFPFQYLLAFFVIIHTILRK